MFASNGYAVSVQIAPPRGFAAVRARVPKGKVSAVFGRHLDQVYAARKSGIVQLDGQNIFVYRALPDAPNELDVEFGVGVTAPFAGGGDVKYTELPTGTVATTTYWGDYGKLGAAHQAVTSWCRDNAVQLADASWEVYGHWPRDGSEPRTDIYYLVAQ